MGKINKRIVTFGEIMLRINPCLLSDTISGSSSFVIGPGGSESNVAVALSNLGDNASFVTKIPTGLLSEKVIKYLRSHGVDTSSIAFGGDRLGVYWTEIGVGPRPSQVIYDRKYSAFSELSYSDFNWKAIFKDAGWFHSSGISAAVSDTACKVLKKIFLRDRNRVNMSIDLNFRGKLWEWAGKKKTRIHRLMREISSGATLITGNETDFYNALGLGPAHYKKIEDYEGMVRNCFRIMPRVKYIAISLREATSASENIWSGVLFSRKNNKILSFKGPEIKITNIVDRIGTGDSFTAGIIHGIAGGNKDLQSVVDFAVGLSALNHTRIGDTSEFKTADVRNFLKMSDIKILR